MAINRSWKERIDFYIADTKKVLPLIIVGLIFMVSGLPIAKESGLDFLAPWGVFVGATFWAGAISHVMRRTLFPWLDLQVLTDAAKTHPVGAGLVFVGVCLVLSSLINLTGAMLRT